MKILEFFARYIAIQIKVISLKGIAFGAFFIPFFMMVLSFALGANSGATLGHASKNASSMLQSGLFDWWAIIFGSLSKLIIIWTGYSSNELTVFILTALLFGLVVNLFISHLVYAVYELSVGLHWKFNTKGFVSRNEVAEYVYWKMFRESLTSSKEDMYR